MSRSAPQNIVLLVLVIYLAGCLGSSNSGDGQPKIRCKEAERQALLTIKADLHEQEEGVLSSWGKDVEKAECCEWIGIQCDSRTGHVISLDLSPLTLHKDACPGPLEGNISTSLVNLEYLNYLDLSCVGFHDNSMPSFIGTLSKLRYLDLSSTSLSGEVPHQLGNLSSLQVLNLSYNYDLKIKKLEWASHLSSLRQLDLSHTSLYEAHDWVQVVNNLPCLTNLMLSDCDPPGAVIPHDSVVNSSKTLSILLLSGNDRVSTSLFPWLFSYSHSLVHLDLSSCRLNTSLVSFGRMTALTYLDLSLNELESSIPNSFGNMTGLVYLDLRGNALKGPIPESFGNLVAITHLDLSYNQLEDSIPESFGNLVAITHLDLSHNQLEGSIPESFGNMTAIVYLSLGSNQLEGSIPEGFGNMVSIEVLDLSNNTFEGDFPKSIWKICTLRQLVINDNNLSGRLPQMIEPSSGCAYFPFEHLDLSHNKFLGPFPNVTLFQSLESLWLDSNELNGSIPESIGQLSRLKILGISSNYIKGVISEAHFSKLFNLTYLDLSSNPHIVLRFHSDWAPPFQLRNIYLGSCTFDPHEFPKWLQTQKSYEELDISNSGISDSLPHWFWNLPTWSRSLDLSNNEIRGTINDVGEEFNNASTRGYLRVDLSSNQIEGPVPHFLLEVATLSLQKNRFSDLNSLCKGTSYLTFLDISHNQLTGELPDCWSNMQSLQVLILSGNKLSGRIPTSIGFLTRIEALHLSNNTLTAELPSLENCTELVVFDVGKNELSGPIPEWIGKSLTKLIILSLRSNNFSGSVPLELCHLVHLQVLDLSSNNLFGSIPNCIGDIDAMKKSSNLDHDLQVNFTTNIPRDFDFYSDKLFLEWKGALTEFINLGLLRNIDLSSNKLIGEIPREITALTGLVSLNLSRNNLSGQIPKEIGRLRNLDALDLSRNHLSGQLPPSLSQIDRLNTLDLSSNNLTGKIPTGPQLQTRDAAAYMENPELCGVPLQKKCPGEEESTSHGTTEDANDEQEEDHFATKGFYISAAVGFIVGFWGVCGTLIFNKSCRYKYYKMLDNKGDWLYVTVAVHKAKLLRIIKN